MAGAFLIAKKQSGDDVPLRATNDGALKVDIGSATLSVDANGVEIKNDTGNPVPASLQALPLPDGASTAARQDTANTALANIDADLGSPADAPATSDSGAFSLFALFKRGLGNWTTLLARIPALVNGSISVTMNPTGPTVATLTSIDSKQAVPRTPTTTSMSSTISSTLLLAANTDRRGLSIANDSTASLRLSFSNPATTANAFLVMAPNSFLLLDQQLITTNAIYGLWTSANGTAQITEFI